MRTSADLERDAALQVATLMAAAARTAPKTRGIDNIRVLAIDDEPTRQKLVTKMREIGQKENRPSLIRDAGNIEKSPLILIIGVESNPAGLDCGFCGKNNCEALKHAGGICAFNSIDLGIATCSAATVAAAHHVDNRMMYSIGRAAIDLGFFNGNVKQALGLPLSITGKNPYFDRKP
ncbi:MAG: DUF2148 domain-containing protein [Verrucomicrobiae bacterium]|nr:DUF2148 domain-containing protein [Verrucomicrobiae bacterium]